MIYRYMSFPMTFSDL